MGLCTQWNISMYLHRNNNKRNAVSLDITNNAARDARDRKFNVMQSKTINNTNTN